MPARKISEILGTENALGNLAAASHRVWLQHPLNPLTHFSLRLTQSWRCKIEGHDVVVEKTRPLLSGPAWCSLQVGLTLRLSHIGGLLIFGKGWQGGALLRKGPSTGPQMRTEAFCRKGNGNGFDFEPVLT